MVAIANRAGTEPCPAKTFYSSTAQLTKQGAGLIIPMMEKPDRVYPVKPYMTD
jgi:hypothetical protein